MKLVIALATRGRPVLLLETLTRTLPNITEAETQLIVMVDSDDAPTIKCLEAAFPQYSDSLIVNIAAREDTVAEKFNRALHWNADVYMAMVDHTHVVTKGFDKLILDAAAKFPDGIGFVFNHMANASFVATYCWTRKVADLMGYLFPPYFPFWFIDHWVDDIARMTGRISYAHFQTDSSRKTLTQEMREANWWSAWFDAAFMMRRKLAQKIVESPEFKQLPWCKGMFDYQDHPLIRWQEHKSRWVNDFVRQANYPSLPQDERYLRMKAKAIAMLPEILSEVDEGTARTYSNFLNPPKLIPALKRAFA